MTLSGNHRMPQTAGRDDLFGSNFRTDMARSSNSIEGCATSTGRFTMPNIGKERTMSAVQTESNAANSREADLDLRNSVMNTNNVCYFDANRYESQHEEPRFGVPGWA